MITAFSLPPRRRRYVYPVLFAVVSVSILFFVCTRIIRANPGAGLPLYSIVIDAGSTGSRVHIYAYSPNFAPGGLPLLDLERTAVMRTTPGLSSYANEPALAGEDIKKLLDFAKGKIGERRWGETDVRLMATAGLRLVEVESREKVLEECRRVLRASGLLFEDEWASVIPGSDEGLYAWVAANYALGSLGGDPKKTIGIIELGGASAQLTFISDEALPAECRHVLTFGKTTYNLYSNSFLHFGQNAALESLSDYLESSSSSSSAVSTSNDVLVNPCIPKGFSMSSEPRAVDSHLKDLEGEAVQKADGNFTACRLLSHILLQKGKGNCECKTCHMGSIVPELRGQILATENFYFTTEFFGLSNTSSLSELMFSGEQFCKEDWSTLREQYAHLGDRDISHYCFSAAYIVALLHDNLHIPLDAKGRVLYANQVGDIQVEWPLGAFLTSRTSRAANRGSETANFLSANVHNNFLLAFLLLSALLVVGAWLAARWRKPHSKTIYDLEKNRYITTRIS